MLTALLTTLATLSPVEAFVLLVRVVLVLGLSVVGLVFAWSAITKARWRRLGTALGLGLARDFGSFSPALEGTREGAAIRYEVKRAPRYGGPPDHRRDRVSYLSRVRLTFPASLGLGLDADREARPPAVEALFAQPAMRQLAGEARQLGWGVKLWDERLELARGGAMEEAAHITAALDLAVRIARALHEARAGYR